LSSYIEINLAIQKFPEIINEYFDADRTYIFENDFTKNITRNTYEYVKILDACLNRKINQTGVA